MQSKALGLKWDVSRDTFSYVKVVSTTSSTTTKRDMLRQVASLYDPLVLVIPIVILGRMLFQAATKLKLGWDDPVPRTLNVKWRSWCEGLDELPNLRFARL